MQQRRLRPGDVLDDYCPRERRITDHAIVAMIDDEIKQTRCVSCDTEHEYKQARVPPQRRKKAPPALFTQVLDGLQGSARLAQTAGSGPPGEDFDSEAEAPPVLAPPAPEPQDEPRVARDLHVPEEPAAAEPPSPPTPAPESSDDEERVQEEGPVRRPLIRAQLPRHEGQQPPTRELPDFTIRQPTNGRGTNRPGSPAGRPAAGRRRPGGHQGPSSGQTRFGGGGHGRTNQFGRSGDRRQGAGHGQGHGQGQGQGQAQGRGGRPNRGGRRGGAGGGGKKH